MMLGLRGRQILALVTVVAVLGIVSLAWEINDQTRLAVERAQRDADLAARLVMLQITEAVGAAPGEDPRRTVASDPRLQVALDASTQHAPTVLYAAFTDVDRRVLRHNDPTQVGETLPPRHTLPQLAGFFSPLGFLREIAGRGDIREQVVPLRIGDQPFGAVRIGVATTFVRQDVTRVLTRGLLIGGAFVLIAVLMAFSLTRIVVGPLGEVRRGIEALRAGDFTYRVPQQNIQEFGKVADALNQLGAEFRARELSKPNEQSLRRALDLMEDGLLIVGSDRTVTHINPLAARFLGFSATGALGRPLSEVVPEAHPLRDMVDSLLEGRTEAISVRAELPGRRGHEGVIAVGHRVHEDENAMGVMVELKDLSVLRDLQAVMDHSTVLSRLGEMAAGVAHEIRNPLNAITLHLEPLLWNQNPSPAEVREAVETTREQITRLDRAVSGFLKVARLRRLTLTSIDPAAIVRDVVDLLAPEATLAGLDLESRVADDVPDIAGDPEVLKQALTNAVKNAIQAVPSRDGRVLVGCRCGEDEVRIFIHDTGPGMDEETRQRAFDLYMTTKTNGTGVGLPYILQAVEMHGGRVELASTAGEGTTVHFVLPPSRSPNRHRRVGAVAGAPIVGLFT